MTAGGKKTLLYCVSTIIDFPYGSFAKSAGVTVEHSRTERRKFR